MTVGSVAAALLVLAPVLAIFYFGHRAAERQDLALREHERHLGRRLTPGEVWRINLGLDEPLPSPVRKNRRDR